MLNILKSQKQIITEIHNEFDTAQDRLLTEARNIIKASNVSNDKCGRLEKAGFVGSDIVVKAKGIVKTKEQADLIEYYKQAYPFQKFISENEIKRICKKYNLIFAPVSAYKKDVPDKNLHDIENAPALKQSDFPKNTFIFKYTSTGNFTWSEKIKLMRGVEIDYLYLDNSRNASEALGRPIETTYNSICSETTEINKQGLFIAAPKSHFNLKGLKRYGTFGMMAFSVIEVKDPIVFRYVRGGVQIITKWGLEAEDKDLTNEKMN